eukprot:EG_transcript_11872
MDNGNVLLEPDEDFIEQEDDFDEPQRSESDFSDDFDSFNGPMHSTRRHMLRRRLLICAPCLIISSFAVLVAITLLIFHHHPASPSNVLARQWLAAPLARCLDGTPAAYYFSPGRDPTKYVIHLQGGGFCYCKSYAGSFCPEWADCKRINEPGRHTSSKDFPVSLQVDRQQLFVPPSLADASIAVVPYCSQDLWAGMRIEDLRGTFNGRYIFESVVAELKARHGLDQASSVLLTGISAGGFGVLYNLDYLASQLSPSVDVSGVANAGFFTFTHMFPDSNETLDLDTVLPLMVSHYNATASLSPECLQDHPSLSHRCFIAPLLAQYVRHRLFILQSLYDVFQLFVLLGLKDPQTAAGMAYLHEVATNVTAALRPYHAASRTGVFAPACLAHEILPQQAVAGRTAAAAVQCWYEERTGACGGMEELAPVPRNCL